MTVENFGAEDNGRIFKVRLVGDAGNVDSPDDAQTKQLTEDPFGNVAGYGEAITRPPYSLEQMAFLAESHPLHGAALEQKSVDVVGDGPEFVADDETEAAPEQRDDMYAWLEGLTEQQTLVELLQAVWLDYETVGFGFIEVARDIKGLVRRLYHIPAHTVRVQRDNKRYVQIRQGRQAWFKRWGVDYEGEPIENVNLLLANGHRAPDGTSFDKLANEVLVFVKPSRRSTWYGIPNYISGTGFITMSLAARDYNIKFFSNAREPRYIIVLEGLSGDVDAVLDELTQELTTGHAEPHRNLILPMSGSAKARIERLTAVQNDMHFVRLMENCDRNILTAHRMPPDRLGSVMRGFLGGNVAANINRIYKDAVVSPAQTVLEDRFGRFVKLEYARSAGTEPSAVLWDTQFQRLDVSDEAGTLELVVAQVTSNIITINEGRGQLGLPTDDPKFDVTLAEFLAEYGGPAGGAAFAAMHRPPQNNDTQLAVLERLDRIDELVDDLLLSEKPDVADEAPAAAPTA